MIRAIFFSLFLFLHAVSAQTISNDKSSEYLIPETSQFVSDKSISHRTFSYPVTRTSSLNGKIELAGLLFLKASASFLLELEQSVFNSNLMWLFQVGGGAFTSHGSSSSRSELASIFIPYASVHTGFRYRFVSGLTFSLAMGTRTFETALWSATSIGWDIMNKVHVELGLTSIEIIPVAFTLSASIPLIKW